MSSLGYRLSAAWWSSTLLQCLCTASSDARPHGCSTDQQQPYTSRTLPGITSWHQTCICCRWSPGLVSPTAAWHALRRSINTVCHRHTLCRTQNRQEGACTYSSSMVPVSPPPHRLTVQGIICLGSCWLCGGQLRLCEQLNFHRNRLCQLYTISARCAWRLLMHWIVDVQQDLSIHIT